MAQRIDAQRRRERQCVSESDRLSGSQCESVTAAPQRRAGWTLQAQVEGALRDGHPAGVLQNER